MRKKANKRSEYVDLYVPVLPGQDSSDLFISLNGKNYLLPRGKTHRVKKAVAKIYLNSMEAQQYQYAHIRELQDSTKASMEAVKNGAGA